MANVDVDVIIVGAGMSGLAAADFIEQDNLVRSQQDGSPVSFLILEGAERSGGRTLTEPNAPGFLDLGGAYVAATQSYVMTMIERFKIRTFDTWLPDDKLNVYESASKAITTYTEPNYPQEQGVSPTILEIEKAILPIRAHLERPWEAYRARELDAITVAQWMDAKMAGDEPDEIFARELLTIAIRSAFSVEPSEISLFYFLYYGATCRTLRAFENVKGGGDSTRLALGTGELLDNLVKAVGPENIRYGCDVLKIEQDDATVNVVFKTEANGEQSVRASRVIVALSPGASSYIEYEPSLSSKRRALAAGAPMAATIKGYLTFDVAWWRPKYSGYVLSAAGPADWTLDNTWWDPSDETWKYPALMTFIVGDEARKLSKLSKNQRKDLLLEQVYRLFEGNAEQFPCTGYYEKDWLKDYWSQGCPAGCLGPGILTEFGEALRTPEGRVHWAGSESATDWMGGYVNGAIQAGIRAAGEVLSLLPEPNVSQR